ncbi:MAG: hypothetical protein ABL967_11245 [Bryobacteraceae bacterium]
MTLKSLPRTVGSAGRSILRGPGLASLDTAILKDTKINESVRIQFRAEGFNILKRANFGAPGVSNFVAPSVTNPTGLNGPAGRIQSVVTSARQIQFGLKLIF